MGNKERGYIALSVLAVYLIMILAGLFVSTAVVVGGLQQVVMLIIGYYFGSSQGSKNKELMLEKINGGLRPS